MQQVQTMSDELLTLTQQAQARERAQRPRDNKGLGDPSSGTCKSDDLLRATADYSSSPPGSPAALELETPSFNGDNSSEPPSPSVHQGLAFSSRVYSPKASSPS